MNWRLWELFEKTVAAYPQKKAFSFTDGSITYQALYESVQKDAVKLSHLGVKEGIKVLLQIEEPVIFASLIMALWKLHALVIPVEKKVTGAEMLQVKRECNCDFIITMPEAVDSLPGRAAKDIPFYCEKVDNGNSFPVNKESALFFYTSGTTGTPKCVIFNHAAMTNNIVAVAQKMQLTAADTFYAPMVLTLPATITTVLFPALIMGATLFINDTQLPRKVLKNLVENQITVFYAVPYIYELIIQTMETLNNNPFATIRLCVSSSAFMKADLFEKFYEYTRLLIRSVYCSSEAGAITYNDAEDLETIRDSVGRPLPGVKVRLSAPDNEMGEILVSGANIACGYFNRPELQKEVFIGNEVKTGDWASQDKAGFITLKGRVSDAINVAGHLVNPKEIEDLILTMDGILEVLVYSIRKDVIGEYIVAKVVSDHRQVITEQDIIQYCSRHSTNYKVPRKIEFVDCIQTGRYGKKLRIYQV